MKFMFAIVKNTKCTQTQKLEQIPLVTFLAFSNYKGSFLEKICSMNLDFIQNYMLRLGFFQLESQILSILVSFRLFWTSLIGIMN
jgi:hypothetical protein